MPHGGSTHSQARISGQTILNELIRNMELGRLELGYTILLPCLYSVYLHPDDYARLRPVQDLIKEDAKRALNARLNECNAKSPLLGRGRPRKVAKIAQSDWWIGLFADAEGAVPAGDVEIHSELNDLPQPGYRGIKTTLIDRSPSVTSVRVARDRENTRKLSSSAFAKIRYQDDSGPQTYFVTQNEISIGRGGEDLWVDLPLYTNDEVSREHVRLRRDPSRGGFTIVDESRNGTWLNGRRLERGVEESVPDRAEIGIAEVLQLSFETLR
jgi:FHA domain-containing protein